jgi:hypothetical protein
MSIRGSNGIDTLVFGVFDHLQKLGIDIRLALKIKNQVEEVMMQFVDSFPKKVLF